MKARIEQSITYQGITWIVLMSPGQLINKRKAFAREMARREKEQS